MSITQHILKTLDLSNDLLEDIGGVKYLPYKMLWGRDFQGYSKKTVQTVLSSVVKKGLVEKRLDKKDVYLALTELGQSFLNSHSVTKASLTLSQTEKKWDGLYRLIFFDIPEANRPTRDLLRRRLQEVGAVCWQKSVWVTKENITRALNDFIAQNHLEDYLGIVEVKEIYNPKLKKLLNS